MGNSWFKTNYTETIYSPSNTVKYVEPITVSTVPSGTTNVYMYLGSNYHALTFNPNNSNHADGVQFVTFNINISGALDSGEYISNAYIARTGSSQTFGDYYGNNDNDANKWALYAEISTSSIRVFVKGLPRSFTNGQYRLDFFTNKSRTLSIYLYLGTPNGRQLSGFKSLDSTYTPSGYPKTIYVSYVSISGSITPGYYLNSRWIMCTDDQYYNNNSNQPYAKDNSGLWYVFNDSLNFAVQGNQSGAYTVENSYATVNMTLYYPKFINDTVTNISMGSKQIGSSYTVPQNSEAGTRTHYNFVEWEYNGDVVSAGQTIYSYPNQGSLTSTWTPKQYTVNFVINESSSTPSSVASRTITYGNYTPLPSLTSPTADFIGWSDGNTTYPANYTYYPQSNITLTAVFENKQFTVRFYDGDGNEIPDSSQTVIYPATVNVPSTSALSNFTFVGWASKGTTNILVGPTGATYQPTYSVDLIRIYSYQLILSWEGGSGTAYSGYYSQGLTVTVPKHDSNNRPILSGYRFTGWAKTHTAPALNVNPTPDYDSGTVPITLSTNFNRLYATYRPATLTVVSIASHSLNVRVGETVNINGNSISFQPSDWKGSLSWTTQGNNNYFTITPHANDNGADIYGVSTTQGSDTCAIIRGYKETWNTSAGYISDSIYITVSDYIQVAFHTRNEMGEEMLFGVYSVDDSDGYTWMDTYPFTHPPTRAGFIFDGWVDAEGKTVTADSPPHYPIDVYATWLSTYTPIDRDMLILQKFSNDGSVLEYSIDVGVVADMGEVFSLSLTTMPTPTKSSDNTFITDLSVTETIKFDITRKNPTNPNDTSDNPLAWSNAYWIERIRKLVDRWQSESDGIKALYIPRGLRYSTINGERVYYGDNYDLLGYVKLRNDNGTINSGLLYDNDKVLVGYNGVITVYNDTYTAGTPDVITVSMTLSLGGMQAGYEDLSRSLLNQG